jgi:hypothetical protein
LWVRQRWLPLFFRYLYAVFVLSLTLLLRQAQHEGERNQKVVLILSLSKDEVVRTVEATSATS